MVGVFLWQWSQWLYLWVFGVMVMCFSFGYLSVLWMSGVRVSMVWLMFILRVMLICVPGLSISHSHCGMVMACCVFSLLSWMRVW